MVYNFEDSPQGLVNLNKHLEDKSYIDGYTPSQSDVQVYEKLTSTVDANKLPHVHRWSTHISSFTTDERKAWTAAAASSGAAKEAKEDDFELFGEDEEADAAWEAEIERRAQENAEKKKASGKKQEVLKSAVVIDVKPWDDTTDLKQLEEMVRGIAMEGLEWKASKIVDVAYGIKKIQISCHVVDDLVSVDDIQEKIQAFEDHVQSTDIHSFCKL